MTRQGFNIEVRQFPDGWRANFIRRDGRLGRHGLGLGEDPWTAVQRAAREALSKPNAV